MVIDFTIGYPKNTLSFTGMLFILHLAYTIFSLIALFMIFFAIERKLEKNTHYILSMLVILTAILTVTNYLLLEEISVPFFTFAFVYPIWIATILALPLLYINIAIRSEGSVRNKALLTAIGMISFEFGLAINSPEALPVFAPLGADLLLLFPPILQIIGATLVYLALRQENRK